MTSQDTPTNQVQKIFSKSNIKDFTIISAGLGLIILIYHLFSGTLAPVGLQPPTPGGNQGPPADMGPVQGPGGMGQIFSFWPIWGVLALPSVLQIILASGIFLTVGFIIYRYYDSVSSKFVGIVLLSLFSIVLTNIIQGWDVGIVSTIGGGSEIYQDAISITSAFDFISNFNAIQSSLSLHAVTQPPGAVLTIYLLYTIFGDPAGVALGLAIIATVVSLFALRSIFRHFFSERTTNYGLLLYAFLPAIQVYYLANIYAIVATIAILSLYFYLHQNQIVSYIGTIITTFLGTFVSFLFLVIPLTFLLNDLLKSFLSEESEARSFLNRLLKNLLKPVSILVSIILLYGILYVVFGFNYIEAFLTASASENPNGFMLLASPAEYVITRIEDILDILVFLGPVLIAFCYRGLQLVRSDGISKERKDMMILVMSAFVALFLLFLTGAPKKGETARICMFILPFVLMPVLHFVDEKKYPKSELILLLLVVFAQAVIMQLIGTYLW
ncbi:MAG: hypothetical protein ACFFF4_10745 [Candidatus Thorarchaeota archaeon]